ncbi:MAG: histidinol-phosphatase [Spirochaetaceae bacterium]|nr:histidinol-phosphatase [Spirochaetaceae bacterium]
MKTNYHTHSTYCDGSNTPEEIVQVAISKGFTVLGFSSHSLFPFGTDWHMPPQQFNTYREEISFLQKKYKSQIEILCGLESDYLPPLTIPRKENYKTMNLDYLIGSTHYVSTKQGWFTVDGSTEEVAYGLNTLFKGNGKKLVQKYFALQREMIQCGDFDIIGHADVIRKRNSELHFFDEKESWYKRELEATAKELSKKGIIAEINTGGIARKVINDVYPSATFLQILHRYNVPITINSDAHSANDLDYAFDFAKKCAVSAGYKETLCLKTTNKGLLWQPVPL